MYQLRILERVKRSVSAGLIASITLQVIGVLLLQMLLLYPRNAEAATVTIDSTASTASDANNIAGAQTVFTDDQVGYTFYRDSTGQCVYSKTTNGGDSWGTAVLVDAQTDCLKVVVWYDRWTPGDNTGTKIHISTMDSSDDDLFYNQLDTSTDTRLLGSSPVNASANSGQSPTLTDANAQTITKATDGKIYMAINDQSDAFIISCTSSCGTASNWTEVGASPLDSANDFVLLMPLAAGSVMLINRDLSADDLRSSIWAGTTWSSWATIDANASESSTYDVGMSATVNKSNNNILLAYAADHGDNKRDDDVRTARYASGSWSATTDLITNDPSRKVHDVAIALDQNTETVYVAYSIETTFGTAASANIYWKSSTNNMTSWGSQQGPVNASAADIYGLSMNINDHERIYATWYDPALSDRLGNTVADISPDTILTALGTQKSQALVGTNNFYIGGSFAITSLSSRNVSAITITETGSIDAQNDINNIKLYYDLDTVFPYNCADESYGGGETQFGTTDTNGFSGINGQSAFSGSVVAISPTQTMCVYVVFDILNSANDGDDIEIQVTNPATDVSVSGITVFPVTPITLAGTTNLVSPNLTQTHFHWRNDDGSEALATSATGGSEDVVLTSLQRESPRRLRLQVSNEGSTSTVASLRLEYGEAAPTCADIVTWTDVGVTDDAWNMSPTGNLTEGADTTNVSNALGGVTNENTTFKSPNGAVRDTTSSLGALTLAITDYVEMEFSVVASSSAIEGQTYCFRVTNAGTPINTYSVYPAATIDADIRVTALGSHVATVDIPSTNNYFGGSIAVKSNTGSHSVTSITISESGTVNAETGLLNTKLFYDLDTAFPYNCVDESYSGGETQFGATDTDGFSAPNGTSTFTGSVSITPTSTLCLYIVSDVSLTPSSLETVAYSVFSPATEIIAGSASVAPSSPVSVSGSTTLQGGLLTQTHYHWRNNDGGESTSTSATAGAEDTAVGSFDLSTPIRLRLGVSNEGATTSVPTRFRLEFAPKITTCSAVSIWKDVDATTNDDWDMYDSALIINADDTTNIAVSSGGVTDENTTFKTPNGALLDTQSITATTSLKETEHLELEYSIKSTNTTSYSTTYCFRVSSNGVALPVYSQYPEITTTIKRDYKVQRGNAVLSGASLTLVAGTDYVAPQTATSAFIRITNSHNTGAGNTSGGGTQNADDVTAFISNPENILTSVTFARLGTTNDTSVDWEIVEFVGASNTDNEMIVRDVGTVSLSSGTFVATGTAVSVTDNSDVVVYITGIKNSNTSRNYYGGQFTSDWNGAGGVPVFTREADGGSTAEVSYAVVEYVGQNWKVQRVEHAYNSAGAVETESITAVNSLARTFIHTQKRMSSNVDVVEFGHTVWLSSIGAVSFLLEGGATFSGQTSVAWIVENVQTGLGKMEVQRRNGNTTNGAEPLSLSISIPLHVSATNNTSVFFNSSAAGANFNHPRAIAGARLTSTSTYQIWRSDTGSTLTYRTEIVEWPVADLAQRQNYYRFYVDSNTLTPYDPWPPGATDLGENTSITALDKPLGIDDYLRLRISIKLSNANMPAGFQQYKLQFSEKVTTCTAATGWLDLGGVASSSAWRGYSATGTADGNNLSGDPPTPGDLLISVSNVAGRLVHQNPSSVNAFSVYESDNVEYDWYIQQNGALPETVYCFRIVKSDNSLLEGYINYPEIKTAGFFPATENWRWYSDPENETPSSPLASENVTPNNIVINDTLALRITVHELNNVSALDKKFKLQFSEYSDFRTAFDVVASSTCAENSLWCYIDGGGADNATITTAVLSDGDGCVAGAGNGCGTHNASSVYAAGHTHNQSRAQEYSFTIKQAGARVNAIYYFRIMDIITSSAVPLNTGETYPSLQVGPSTMSFSIAGLPAGTTTAGVVTDATTTATGVSFGSVPFNDDRIAAQRISVSTNATEGYQVLQYATQELLSSNGIAIGSVSSTNAVPSGWATGCSGTATGCIGYHTTDAILEGGSPRFAPSDTYAPLHTEPYEVIYSSVPVDSTEDIVYRIYVTEMQPAGDYETSIVYIAVPVF